MATDPPPVELVKGTLSTVASNPEPKAHTHKRLKRIIDEQAIGPIERMLLWLAKTDLYVLHVVPNNCRTTLASLGMMVVFTTVLAFGTSLYTVLTMVVGPDTPARYPIALMIASVYAFGIMIIDREIVGATSKSSLAVRFVFAICIALVVSWPVKIRLFEGKINQELVVMAMEQQATAISERDDLKRQAERELERLVAERNVERGNLIKRLQSHQKELATLDEAIANEADVVRCGPLCQRLRADKAEVELRAKQVESQLAALTGNIPVPETLQLRIDHLQSDISAATDRGKVLDESKDILSKWEALQRVGRNLGPGYEVLSIFVLLFFMLLEMVPLALKWSLGKMEYQYYVEARTNINNQKIISLTNLYMNKMQTEDRAILDGVPPEITDMLAWLMEDESREHRPDFDPRSLRDLETESKVRLASSQGRAGVTAGAANHASAQAEVHAADPPIAATSAPDDTINEGPPSVTPAST